MKGIPTLGGGDGASFDEQDAYVPEHLPEPGSFLSAPDVEVLTGDEHVRVHRTAREVFETRGVYDVTFGYNLAKLNRDTRHAEAGLRYAREVESDGDERVLRVEFTPTTEFCPQGESLAVGTFRAFNGESDAHEYDRVRVRIDGMHQNATPINGQLKQLERAHREEGTVPEPERSDAGEHDGAAAGGGFSAPF